LKNKVFAAARQLLIDCLSGLAAVAMDRSLGGFEMKKITVIAGLASVGAVAAVLWTVPAVASTGCSAGCTSHDARSGREERANRDESSDEETSSTSVPEPGTLALLGLGLSGLGLTGLGRKRTKK
jgi:PEP-CTERM motif